MAKILFAIIFALSSILPSISVAKEKEKRAKVEQAVFDPVASFELIVRKLEKFLSSPQRYMIVSTSRGYEAEVIVVWSESLSYDVKKTDSLVSPYMAVITLNYASSRTAGCSPGFKVPTEQLALTAADNTACYMRKSGDRADLIFALQNEKWVLKDVTSWLSNAFGFYKPYHQPPSDQEAVAMNMRWRDAVSQ